METVSKKSVGHSIRTYRVRLYDRHFAWLKTTKELYNQVVRHFFHALLSEQKQQQNGRITDRGLEHEMEQQSTSELLLQSNFVLLRLLETKCIGTKEMKAKGQPPDYPLSVEGVSKIPLYFRRSAINTAIDLFRKGAENGETIVPNMVLYKGMYQNFTDNSIELKLYNGEKWVWVTYPFADMGRNFPSNAIKLSPSLVLRKKDAWLEVPLSFEVQDVRTVKERMQTEERICAVAFPDQDVLAVAVILNRDGTEWKHRFFRGGKQREQFRKRMLERIRTSKKSRGMWLQKNDCSREKKISISQRTEEAKIRGDNSQLYEEIRELNRYYSHCISRQIIQYCLEQEVKVIVVPKYEGSIDFQDKRYLNTDAYRWLGRSIIQNLKYKAFEKGIVVTAVPTYHSADCCSECGEKIKRYNEGHIAGRNYYGGKLFVCPKGHKGNTAGNTAKNLGRSFLKYFDVKINE